MICTVIIIIFPTVNQGLGMTIRLAVMTMSTTMINSTFEYCTLESVVAKDETN